MIYSWSSQNTAGETKKKCTTAIVFIGQSAGNIIGPHLYTPSEAPLYRSGLISNLVLFVLLIVFTLIISIYIFYLNKVHARTRTRVGKSADVVDRSLLSQHEIDLLDGTSEGESGLVGEKAFDDETDLKNEDFIFVF